MAGSRAAWYDRAWKYRREIVIDRAKLPEADLKDFPLLVSLTEPLLRSAVRGEDFLFTASDGISRLESEIQLYDPDSGSLRAWVRIPTLDANHAVLYLYYGNPSLPPDRKDAVWDAHYRLVLHAVSADRSLPDSTPFGNHGVALKKREGSVVKVGHVESLNLAREITVEAWVDGSDPRTDAIQSIVSKWSLRRTMDAFEARDAGDTDGLNTKGFFGAVFDGRYIYFVPQYDGTLTDGRVVRHGKVLRYDTHGAFKNPRNWSAYDAGATLGLNTKGYYGAVATKRYVYFVPRTDGAVHHSRVLRYDRAGDFKDPRSWTAHDAGVPVSYQSAAYDGRHIYFAPGYEGQGKPSGKVLRYDTHGPLEDPKSYVTYDAGDTSGLNARCYDGAAFDGRYVYFSPLDPIGIILRHDTQGEFTDPNSWTARDAGRTSGLQMGQCVGAICDGRFVYFVPYANSVVVRCDTRGEFSDTANWLAYDAGRTSGLRTKGYDGAAFDGRYVYFIPFWEGDDIHAGWHGKVLRYDTQGSFTEDRAWEARDAGKTDGLRPVGFNGGAFDGRYLYFAPWREGTDPDGRIRAHGHVLRYDTTGTGASFSLRYTDCGHNGGLCAALPGPAFLVNTERGVRNARADRALDPGEHHIAGVYDGKSVRLYVDGALESEQEGGGAIVTNDADVFVGGIQDGLGDLRGTISEIRISDTARSADWIRTGHANQRSPQALVRVGSEEHWM